jgi:hypothetical protein
MKTQLVTLGDSWPQGGELKGDLGEVPYGNLLQHQLGFDEFYNYGSAGASNEDTLYQLHEFLSTHWQQNNQVTAIFHLTNPARTAHFPRFFSWDVGTEERKQWPTNARQNFMELFTYFHRDGHEVMRSSTTVTALQTLCQKHHIQDFYFSGWVKYPRWLAGVDTASIWKQGTETASDWFGIKEHNGEHVTNCSDNPYIYPNFAHPNQQGHELIAKNLRDWITSSP